MTRRNLDILVTLACVAVALAGWMISYRTQVQLAFTRGNFEDWEAWCWPAATEATALVMMIRLALGQIRPGAWTVGAWLLILASSAVMVAANVIADLGNLLAAGMHSAVPIIAMAIWLIVVHGRPKPTASKPIRTLKEAAPETRPVARARQAAPPAASTNGHAPVAAAEASDGPCEVCHQDPCIEPKKHLATLRKRRQRARMQDAVTA